MKSRCLWLKKLSIVKAEFKTAKWRRTSRESLLEGLGLMARGLNIANAYGLSNIVELDRKIRMKFRTFS